MDDLLAEAAVGLRRPRPSPRRRRMRDRAVGPDRTSRGGPAPGSPKTRQSRCQASQAAGYEPADGRCRFASPIGCRVGAEADRCDPRCRLSESKSGPPATQFSSRSESQARACDTISTRGRQSCEANASISAASCSGVICSQLQHVAQLARPGSARYSVQPSKLLDARWCERCRGYCWS